MAWFGNFADEGDGFLMGTNFREFVQKLWNPQNLILLRYLNI